jgi:hypothetical protein
MNRILVLVLLYATVSGAAAAPGTMRVDFFHSGNHMTELFSLDQVVIEPLPWPGNMAQPIDRTLRGKYLFQIVSNGEIKWSRSFSSIYGEWETTGEARKISRSFHESVRFPAQEDEFELVLKKRYLDNEFGEVWRVELDPDDVLVHREAPMYTNRVVAIHESGDPASKVDLLIMGDGYTAAEQDAFIATAREATEILLNTSPFRERKDDFNVWALAPAATQSGISRPSTRTFRESPIGSTYDSFRSERYILTFDNKAMRRIASSAPYDFIEILTNSEVYGGGGIYGLFSTAAANNAWLPYLFVHEFGHHFAGLADEYYTSSVAYESPEIITEPYEPNVTALLDPKNLKWKHLATPNTPLPTPWPKAEYEEHSNAYQEKRREMRAANVGEDEMNALFRDTRNFVDRLFSESGHGGIIGAFEGGNYQSEGIYRPAQNCIMFTRSEPFCAVCAEAIGKVIDEYTLSD